MLKIISSVLTLFLAITVLSQPVYEGNSTPTYDEAISIYKELAEQHSNASLYQKGLTDSGEPLHLMVIGHPEMPGLQPHETAQFNKRVLLINNAIHPGEACGVNASIMLARYLLEENAAESMLQNTVVCIIPVYSIGGALQRNAHSRANQNGPVEYGFRGNARNLDLNRDFTKMDSRNAKSFARIFHEWDPHVYLETHTSNGADYQYTMTFLSTQKDKLAKEVSQLMVDSIRPGLYQRMKDRDEEMVPYVNVFGRTPEDGGITGFFDTPRYSSGFTTQFQCMGFMSEAHMLKPFEDRVNATFKLMLSILEEMELHGPSIAKAREEARDALIWKEAFTLQWELDTIPTDTLDFLGYGSGYRKSAITGADRLYYDQNDPKKIRVPLFDDYKPAAGVMKPHGYIVPLAWHETIDRLRINGAELSIFTENVTVAVERYYIESQETGRQPYEGHYLHSNTKVSTVLDTVQVRKGDVWVPMNTIKDRFVVEVLEPTAPDSYFNWNFFDEILQQKEWFSSYVYEDEAETMLKEDPELKEKFEALKSEDKGFAENAFAQLYWLYRQSDHYEEQHQRYPVLRVNEPMDLPLTPMRR